MSQTFKCSLIVGTLMFFFNIQTLYCQQNPFDKLQLFFYTNDDNTILTVNDNGTKNLSFQVKGLKDNDEASLFISTLKSYKGILDIQISEPLTNQLRQVKALCHPGYTLNNVNVVIGQILKINEVYVNNDKVKTKDLEQFYK